VSKHIVNKKVSMVRYFGRPATLTRLELIANSVAMVSMIGNKASIPYSPYYLFQ